MLSQRLLAFVHVGAGAARTNAPALNVVTLIFIALILGPSPVRAASTSTSQSTGLNTVTWTYTVNPGTNWDSLHISGPIAAPTASITGTGPAGWTFGAGTSGSTATYSWTGTANLTGPQTFTLTVDLSAGTDQPANGSASVQYDVAGEPAGTWHDVIPTPPATPSYANWIFVPVPEPSLISLLALGGLALLWPRRS